MHSGFLDQRQKVVVVVVYRSVSAPFATDYRFHELCVWIVGGSSSSSLTPCIDGQLSHFHSMLNLVPDCLPPYTLLSIEKCLNHPSINKQSFRMRGKHGHENKDSRLQSDHKWWTPAARTCSDISINHAYKQQKQSYATSNNRMVQDQQKRSLPIVSLSAKCRLSDPLLSLTAARHFVWKVKVGKEKECGRKRWGTKLYKKYNRRAGKRKCVLFLKPNVIHLTSHAHWTSATYYRYAWSSLFPLLIPPHSCWRMADEKRLPSCHVGVIFVAQKKMMLPVVGLEVMWTNTFPHSVSLFLQTYCL